MLNFYTRKPVNQIDMYCIYGCFVTYVVLVMFTHHKLHEKKIKIHQVIHREFLSKARTSVGASVHKHLCTYGLRWLQHKPQSFKMQSEMW
jgi:hypothetical protein